MGHVAAKTTVIPRPSSCVPLLARIMPALPCTKPLGLSAESNSLRFGARAREITARCRPAISPPIAPGRHLAVVVSPGCVSTTRHRISVYSRVARGFLEQELKSLSLSLLLSREFIKRESRSVIDRERFSALRSSFGPQRKSPHRRGENGESDPFSLLLRPSLTIPYRDKLPFSRVKGKSKRVLAP